MSDTKLKILDAAEEVLAERGFEESSLRAITAAAGVNLAAVNYHFGSKERLLQAVLRRRLAPINQERLALLDELEIKAGGRSVPIEEIVHALIAPMVRTVAVRGGPARTFHRILGGLYIGPRETVQNMLVPELAHMFRRFAAALHRSLPGVPEDEIGWRIFFAVGSTAHFVAASGVLRAISDGRCDPSDLEAAIRRLVAFATAGLAARSSVERSSRRNHREPRQRHRPGNP